MQQFPVPSGLFHFFDNNIICRRYYFESFISYFSHNADGIPRSRMRLLRNEFVWNFQCPCQLANLIGVQFAYRFNKSEFHVFWKPANVMMTFNFIRMARSTAFYNIRINSTLYKEFGLRVMFDDFLENINIQFPDSFSFFLGVGNPFECSKKSRFCVNNDRMNVQFFRKV